MQCLHLSVEHILLHINECVFVTDGKTLASFRLLPFFLPSPPRRGVRRPQLSSTSASARLFADIEVSSTEYVTAQYFLLSATTS